MLQEYSETKQTKKRDKLIATSWSSIAICLFYIYIGHFHDDVILLLRPESFRVLLFCKWRLHSLCTDAPYDGFCYLNLAGIGKFKYERKNEKDSGRSLVVVQ